MRNFKDTKLIYVNIMQSFDMAWHIGIWYPHLLLDDLLWLVILANIMTYLFSFL